ncbi:hypothetical protein [Rhizobium sp. 768_B6_N1_8]|uniref:hypothetical protein n=1 Tax=unclassified Rhizobium TaxID=2613769 RepID=UPI003F24EC16
MADIILWPRCLLRPSQVQANVVPFTRSSGRSLGGVEPVARTDLGFWSIEYTNVVMQSRYRDQWRTWQAIRSKLGGRSGLVAVPVPSSLSAPYASGGFEPSADIPFDDDSVFDDDSPLDQSAISIVSEGLVDIGAATMRLRIINAAPDLAGVRFSCNHALYETGPVIDQDGDIWTVSLSTTIREAIPSGTTLEFDHPTCLCHLSDDLGMDVSQDAISKGSRPTVSFVEATDYWNLLAVGAA